MTSGRVVPRRLAAFVFATALVAVSPARFARKGDRSLGGICGSPPR